MSAAVFGPKQNLDYWEEIFNTGKAPGNIRVLTAPLDMHEMIKPRTPNAGRKG